MIRNVIRNIREILRVVLSPLKGWVICLAAGSLLTLGAVGWFHFRGEEDKNLQEAQETAVVREQMQPQKESILTAFEVKSAIEKIGELAVCKNEYQDHLEGLDVKYVRDTSLYPVLGNGALAEKVGSFSLPWTENNYIVGCRGTLKVGYDDLSEILCEVDGAQKVIYISLPDPIVLSHDVNYADVDHTDDRNVWNPVENEIIIEAIEEMKKRNLEKAKEEGIDQKARESMEEIILNVCSAFDGYRVVFEEKAI